jgi:hypothetical protein
MIIVYLDAFAKDCSVFLRLDINKLEHDFFYNCIEIHRRTLEERLSTVGLVKK